jgi:hypothetical protein
LVVADVDGWHVRVVADIVHPAYSMVDGVTSFDVVKPPPLHWTSDGGAIYWLDGVGKAQVVDIATGRSAALPTRMHGCIDLHWQPVQP